MMSDKVSLCLIRTTGIILFVAVMWWGARMIGWNYDDTRTVLGIINGFFPELVFLLGIAGGALVFYRMHADEENNFAFSDLFRAGSAYDIYRFGYFWLLIIAGWVVFVTAWRDKEIVGVLGVVLAAFIAKNIADSMGSAFGKPREQKGEGQ